MVNFDNAKIDKREEAAEATLRLLQQKVREYAADRGFTTTGTEHATLSAAELAEELNRPEYKPRGDGTTEEFPGLFDQMVVGLPYAANTITTADVEEALNA